jgi:hypothetical protein
MPKVEVFFAHEKWPKTLVPRTTLFQKCYCFCTGGHRWRKFLWGGITGHFDCDCCTKCYKFRGPLPENRDTEPFPCYMLP